VKTLSAQLLQSLKKLIGFHKDLFNTVKNEEDSLLEMEIKGIQEATRLKQALIDAIEIEESHRISLTKTISEKINIPYEDLTLRKIIHYLQKSDIRIAESLDSAFRTLKVLTERISVQNNRNRIIVKNSIHHVDNMKNNLFQDKDPKAETYTPTGHKKNKANGPKVISREV